MPMRSWVAALLAAASGCGPQVREAWAVQPNPITSRESADDRMVSVPLYVYQRQYSLPRQVPLRHGAQFVAVARDRVRFHIVFASLFDLNLDARDLDVWLEDDTGRRMAYEAVELPRVSQHQVDVPLPRFFHYRFNVYIGEADIVFHDDDLLSRDRKRLSLVIERDGFEYRYTWNFGDGTEIHDYGDRTSDPVLGRL